MVRSVGEFLDAIIENIISKKWNASSYGDDEICTMVMSRLQAEGYRILDVAIASCTAAPI